MEKIEPGVWQGTYRGRLFRVLRHQGEPWGKVPRLPTFTYHTCGMYREGLTSWRDAERGAELTIDDCLVQEREQAARRWYRERFHETVDQAAAAVFEKRGEGSRRLEEVIYDPTVPASDVANATAAYQLLSSLEWRRWFQERFSETIEEAEAAPPDKRAERIRKLEALRDDKAAQPGEVANATAALARMQAETEKAA